MASPVQEGNSRNAAPGRRLVHHGAVGYDDFLLRVLEKRNARNYLEIGVRAGAVLGRVPVDSIGVDPIMEFPKSPLGNKRQLFLFQMTSDVFFRDVDVVSLLGRPVEMAFLDGLHLFEYLLRDFINTERCSHSRSLIVLDDCLPSNAEMTERTFRPEQRQNSDLATWWTGDVFKVPLILKRYRPDLRLVPVATQPTGSFCITRLDPSSTILDDRYFELVDEYRDLIVDDAVLEEFYAEFPCIDPVALLQGHDLSLYLGCT